PLNRVPGSLRGPLGKVRPSSDELRVIGPLKADLSGLARHSPKPTDTAPATTRSGRRVRGKWLRRRLGLAEDRQPAVELDAFASSDHRCATAADRCLPARQCRYWRLRA